MKIELQKIYSGSINTSNVTNIDIRSQKNTLK